MNLRFGGWLCLTWMGACAREAPEVIQEVPAPSAASGGAAGSDATQNVGGTLDPGSGTAQVAGAPAVGRELSESSHPGFRQPLCFDCHGTVAVYRHVDVTYRPQDCVACHGDNGAPHREHAVVGNPGCPSCHATVRHVPKFDAPADCVACHGAN